MMREETVFGPIHSRRLGRSLGINLLPVHGKLCNFDCIYCECGWNADGRSDHRLATAAEVEEALEAKLRKCAADGIGIDSITFSGDGEPTLNPEFAGIVDISLALRDKYYPAAVVSVLTNATRIGVPEVFDALRRVDNPILKLDAVTDEMARRINAPVGAYHVLEQVEAMKRFEGDFVLQTMFFKGAGVDWADMLEEWFGIVRELRPREVMAYTIDRPVPAAGLEKYTVGEMERMLRPLLDEGYNIKIYG